MTKVRCFLNMLLLKRSSKAQVKKAHSCPYKLQKNVVKKYTAFDVRNLLTSSSSFHFSLHSRTIESDVFLEPPNRVKVAASEDHDTTV